MLIDWPETQRTRMRWQDPTDFAFHKDLSGEIELGSDDEVVLCATCSDEVVKAGQMRRLEEAPQSSQCRRCDRFAWGVIETY